MRILETLTVHTYSAKLFDQEVNKAMEEGWMPASTPQLICSNMPSAGGSASSTNYYTALNFVQFFTRWKS